MQRYTTPISEETLAEIVSRPKPQQLDAASVVAEIFNAVRAHGDAALLEITERFDRAKLDSLSVSLHEVERAYATVPKELKEAIAVARRNIERFHSPQLQAPQTVETMPGVLCWRRSIPISPIGFYIPGGSAALFSSALMMGIPAAIAGCSDIVACTPPGISGNVDPAVLYTLTELGITKIFKIGGAQAIAAMTFGTQSVQRVQKIFGPGNQFVTLAKALATQYGVAIDIPAGPSELAILADHSSNPRFIAADLLSQAEHGADSQVLLVTTDPSLADRVEDELEAQLSRLARIETARQALSKSYLVTVSDTTEGFAILNRYAPEHLIIATQDAKKDAQMVINAGSVFIGAYAPESVGDYASGTNHILPTDGNAARLSGVSVDSFVRKVTFQELTPSGLKNLAPTVETMARAEGLEAHARAVSIRFENGAN